MALPCQTASLPLLCQHKGLPQALLPPSPSAAGARQPCLVGGGGWDLQGARRWAPSLPPAPTRPGSGIPQDSVRPQ